MVVCCSKCKRCYDDEHCWTICPHGPLWAGVDQYDPKTDCVKGITMRDEPISKEGEK
jgi:hypothetical protein